MAKNRWSYSVCNLTSQRILSGCVSVYLHTNFIFVPSVCVCVCVGCWVKPLIEKQATVATCLTVSPSICLEQHGASVRKGGRGSEAGGSDGEPASLHLCFLSLSLFSLFGRQRWSWKRPFLSLSLSPHLLRHPSQCEVFFVFHHLRVSAGSYHNTTCSAVSLAPDTPAPRHFLCTDTISLRHTAAHCQNSGAG